MNTMLNRIVKAKKYKDLASTFPPRIIHTELDLSVTSGVIEALMGIVAPTEDQLDFIEMLSLLVTNYEAVARPVKSVSLAHLLAHLIESSGASKADIARAAHVHPSLISDVLAERRGLSTTNIRKLSTYFHVDPSLFLEAVSPKRDAA
jgi:HTH-type transcriptional regulator / antitoxin HigA